MWKFFLGLGAGAIAGVGALAYVKNRCEEDDEFAEKVDDVIESVCDGFGRAKDTIEETASQVYDSIEKKLGEIDEAFGWGKSAKPAPSVAQGSEITIEAETE